LVQIDRIVIDRTHIGLPSFRPILDVYNFKKIRNYSSMEMRPVLVVNKRAGARKLVVN
jgi:hypothetical protein